MLTRAAAGCGESLLIDWEKEKSGLWDGRIKRFAETRQPASIRRKNASDEKIL